MPRIGCGSPMMKPLKIGARTSAFCFQAAPACTICAPSKLRSMPVAADAAGSVYVAVVSDHRLWGGPVFGESPQNNDIMFAKLRAAAPAQAELGARPPEPPGAKSSEPREKEQVARMRAYTISSG